MRPFFWSAHWENRVVMTSAVQDSATRWGDGRRADTDFAREHLLDAASDCYQRQGVVKTSVEHIAREAKVSRTTVYRYFKNRDEVMTAVVAREAQRLVRSLHERVDGLACFGDFVIETLVTVISEIPRFPIFGLMLSEDSSVVKRLCVGSDEVQAVAVKFMRERFEYAQSEGKLRDGLDLPSLVDWLMLVIAAHLQTRDDDEAELRKTLDMFVRPALLRD